MTKEHKILLINFGGIGDEILFLPTISSLRTTFKDSIITLALEPRSASVMQLTQDIDETFFVDIKKKGKFFGLLSLIFKAWKERFDIVVSSGSNKFIPVLLFLMGIQKRYGYDSGFLAKKLLTRAIPLNKQQYAASMYHDLVSDLTNLQAGVPRIGLEDIAKIPNSVLIHPGVSKMSITKNIYKTPNCDFWAELIIKLLESNKKVRLAGGPDDDELIRNIAEKLQKTEGLNLENFTNLYGKTINLKDLARRIKESEVMICSDSAPMHVGVGVGTKVIALFGPTDEKKLLPQDNPDFKAITADCKCRPCLWDKAQKSCEKKECLNFNIQDILDLVR